MTTTTETQAQPKVKIGKRTKQLTLTWPKLTVGEGDQAKTFECSHGTWGHASDKAVRGCLLKLAAEAGVKLP
jgi:hypothetical protein